jgi:tripartite-type tricarboxylate transporter receptor subunit TctC
MTLGYTRDTFVPLTPVARTSFVLVVRSALDIHSYNDFLKTVARGFTLGFWHEPTARVINQWIELAGIPKPVIHTYTGSTTQAEALVSGEIDFAFDTWVAARANDNVRAIAVLDSESGLGLDCLSTRYPGIDIDNWYGIVAPATMDPELAKKLEQVLAEGFRKDKYRQRLEDLEFRPWSGTADDFREQQQKTIDFYQNIK